MHSQKYLWSPFQHLKRRGFKRLGSSADQPSTRPGRHPRAPRRHERHLGRSAYHQAALSRTTARSGSLPPSSCRRHLSHPAAYKRLPLTASKNHRIQHMAGQHQPKRRFCIYRHLQDLHRPRTKRSFRPLQRWPALKLSRLTGPQGPASVRPYVH